MSSFLPVGFPAAFADWSSLPFPPSVTSRLLDPATLEPGRRVAVRPTLNGGGIVLQGVRHPLLTVHEGLSAYGRVIGYTAWIRLREVTFQVNDRACATIAMGIGAKHPMASATGFIDLEEDAPYGFEVRFNPYIAPHFLRRNTGERVEGAERLTMYGTCCWMHSDTVA